LLWGMLHGVLLGGAYVVRVRLPEVLAVGVTFFSVSLLWVLFRAEGVGEAFAYYGVLFGFGGFGGLDGLVFGYREFLVVLGLGVVWFLPNSFEMKVSIYSMAFSGVVFFVALKFMAATPAMSFVYFNF